MSLEKQRQSEFDMKYKLRPTTNQTIYDNPGIQYDDIQYDESMDTNTIDSLSNMFNMLVLKPTPIAYSPAEIDAASVLLNLNNNQFLQYIHSENLKSYFHQTD